MDPVRSDQSRPGKSWRGKDAPTLSTGLLRRAAPCLLAGTALWLGLDAGWLHAKAWLAQQLLHAAWVDTQATQQAHTPWPWADTTPVARLQAPRLEIDQIVLSGDAGRTLAFGPGWAEASGAPGTHGAVVLSGHRDTHFAFLRELRIDDELHLTASHAARRYRVVSMHVADARHEAIALRDGDDALLLVTCWPFDALAPGGPLRYVVRAEAVGADVAAPTQSRRDSATTTPSSSA